MCQYALTRQDMYFVLCLGSVASHLQIQAEGFPTRKYGHFFLELQERSPGHRGSVFGPRWWTSVSQALCPHPLNPGYAIVDSKHLGRKKLGNTSVRWTFITERWHITGV